MPYKNLTISWGNAHADGFGSQYLRKVAGWAFCLQRGSRQYRYVHTPFLYIDHLSNHPERQHLAPLMNDFIGIEDNRHGKKIHVRRLYVAIVHKNVNLFFNTGFLTRIRRRYWNTWKPESNTKDCVVVHIRRGDLWHKHKRQRDIKGVAHKRLTNNSYYNQKIPQIARDNPDNKIVIQTDGTQEEFASLYDGWSSSLIDAVEIRSQQEIRNSFHDLVCAKKLFMARSSMSYIAALLNESSDIYFQDGWCNEQTKHPMDYWKNWSSYSD